ncbi:4Fe-4S dicluster domain-containing protein [[Eubacterium] cellulosolvens]
MKVEAPIHFIEPNLSSKRLGVINKRLGRSELKLHELRERLLELRKNAVKNSQKNLQLFKSNIKDRENISLYIAKNSEEAVRYITTQGEQTGLSRIDVSRSNTVRGLEPGLIQNDFEVLHTYDYAIKSGTLGVFTNLAPGFYWSLQGLELENTYQSFNVSPEPIVYSKRLITKSTSAQSFLGLVGANVFSATGEILIVQHLFNISSILSHAKQSFIVLTRDKLVDDYTDALFQARCTAMYGLEQIILDLFDNERCKDRTGALQNMKKSATGKKSQYETHKLRMDENFGDYNPPDNLHIIILDDERSELRGSKREDLLYCIGCRRCAQLCPRVRGSGCRTEGEAGNSIGSSISALTARELLMDGFLLGPEKAIDEGLFDCTLCRSCSSICPVDIELTDHLLELREHCQKNDLFSPPHKRIRQNILNVGNAYGSKHTIKPNPRAKSKTMGRM